MHSSTNAAHLSTTIDPFCRNLRYGIAHKTKFKTEFDSTASREGEGRKEWRWQNNGEPEKDKQGTRRERRRGSNGRGRQCTRDISLVCFPLLRGRQLSVAGNGIKRGNDKGRGGFVCIMGNCAFTTRRALFGAMVARNSVPPLRSFHPVPDRLQRATWTVPDFPRDRAWNR